MTAQAAQKIAAGDTDTFTVATATGEHTISLQGQANDTLQGQVNQLNAQMNVLGISASLNTQGELQLQSGSAFSVTASSNSATQAYDLVDLAATPDQKQNAGLYNMAYAPTQADAFTITAGSATTGTITMTDAAPD
jgi:hypothetical protein